jgi:hypothetical protein
MDMTQHMEKVLVLLEELIQLVLRRKSASIATRVLIIFLQVATPYHLQHTQELEVIL